MAANTLLTSSEITLESLDVLENELGFTGQVNKEYSDQFAVSGAKIGYVINVRKPPRYLGRTGQAAQVEGITETSVPVTLTTQYGVDLEVSTADLTLSIDNFSERVISPAVSRIANQMDQDGLALYNQIWNVQGTPGTVPSALLTYLLAGVDLSNSCAPTDKRNVCLTPLMQAYIVDALKGLFQQAGEIARQYQKGRMGTAAGFNWLEDQNCATHTVGAQGGTPLVNGAGQTGSSLATRGWTAAAATRLKQGDAFTLAGVYQVNPQSRLSTGILQKFIATSDFASDGSGNGSINISPSIIVSGAYQTVTAAPADGAAITVIGAANTVSPQGMAFHRDAFTMASADLYVPKGVDMAARKSDKQLGLSIRFVRDWDPTSDQLISRLDVIYGWAVLRGELACRIAS